MVAIDVYGGGGGGGGGGSDPSRRNKNGQRGQTQVVTIDDSSGETMECVIPLAHPQPLPTGRGQPARPAQPAQPAQQQQQPQQSLPVIDSEIDIGHILDIKGSLGTFRDRRQVKVEKIVHLKTTEQEVAFWEKVVQLRREVLDRPWKLEERVVRRLRREAMGVDSSERGSKKREKVGEKNRERRGEGGEEREEREEARRLRREREKEEARRERKRRRRLEEERRKLGEERTEEEREREAKRMRRLEEERGRLELHEERSKVRPGGGDEAEHARKPPEKERTAAVACSSNLGANKQAAAPMVIPTRTKRNVTGLERKVASRPSPIPPKPKEPTGLERKTRAKSINSDRVVVPVTGKYTALGL